MRIRDIFVMCVLTVECLSLVRSFDSQNLNSHNSFSQIRRNCTKCRNIFRLGIAEKRRIEILKKQIKNALNIKENKININVKGKLKENISSETTTSGYNYLQEMAEIVSFSEKPGNISGRNVVSFSIDVSSKPGAVEALSAHLWVLVRKRGRRKKTGKRIILKVNKVLDEKKKKFQLLTSLRTRVKKTRWQKINLPVTLIQSMLDSNDQSLNLKIVCKRCGKVVRPVLLRSHPKRNVKKKSLKLRKRKRKHKGQLRRRLRNRNIRDNGNKRVRPFLVISTRYNHQISKA